MTLVLDSGVLIAAAREEEPEHRACQELLRETRERRLLPAPVLVEVDWILESGAAWRRLLSDVVVGALPVADLTPEDYERVERLMRTYEDLRVGFVDCAVLAVVERLGETKLATLDRRHFSVMRPAHVDALELVPHL